MATISGPATTRDSVSGTHLHGTVERMIIAALSVHREIRAAHIVGEPTSVGARLVKLPQMSENPPLRACFTLSYRFSDALRPFIANVHKPKVSLIPPTTNTSTPQRSGRHHFRFHLPHIHLERILVCAQGRGFRALLRNTVVFSCPDYHRRCLDTSDAGCQAKIPVKAKAVARLTAASPNKGGKGSPSNAL